MFRVGIAGCMLLLAGSGATADSPAERGAYLVNTIMACGNCHTPRDADGKAMAGKAFSGGLTFNTPAFIATASNITPDVETGIGSWSDRDIKRALVEGLRGGRVFPAREAAPAGSPGNTAANITSHPTAGIGAWSDQEVGRAITDGIARDGRALGQPMAYAAYAGLKPADLADIIAYLRTVPPRQ